MKNRSLIFATIFIALLTVSATCEKSKTEPDSNALHVKILSYNIKNCIGMDGVVDYARVANVIKRANADIVAVQELDSATQRSKGVVVLNELARLTGMFPTYGASIDYQGGKYGVGVLSKGKPVSWKRIPLPGREEPRSLLIVEMDKFILACTHFSLTEEDRLASSNIVNNYFKDQTKPVFMAGDLNAVPESTVIKNIGYYWNILNKTTSPTIPSNNPSKCIDYILAFKTPDRTFVTTRTLVEQEPVASDHLPVWVEVEVR
ncbi:MAG TPA: endonuclease/exonuclease/phosphatase family protein, partial [Bacteroidales bacterium]|nr:endonuclease/exonuclease/phosphatase family protein [Bacteroidales bacterium]